VCPSPLPLTHLLSPHEPPPHRQRSRHSTGQDTRRPLLLLALLLLLLLLSDITQLQHSTGKLFSAYFQHTSYFQPLDFAHQNRAVTGRRGGQGGTEQVTWKGKGR